MKKILVISVLVLGVLTSFAQNRHRLDGGEPYDVFVSLRGSYYLPQGGFSDNYKWGAGAKINVEFQYQESKLGWGVSLGYDRFQPQYVKWDYVPTKQGFVAQQIPLTLFANYYFFNEKLKPYVGLGVGTVWGRYDYSFSSEANIQEYYYREYEGQSGFRFGVMPHVGFMFTLDHKNAFGIEFQAEDYFKSGRIEQSLTYSATLHYTYIID